MSWITDDFLCTNPECKAVEEGVLQRRSERADERTCPICESVSKRKPPMLGLMKTSYHMGHKRDDKYKKIKEANAIEMDMYEQRNENRTEHKKAIQKLTGEKK